MDGWEEDDDLEIDSQENENGWNDSNTVDLDLDLDCLQDQDGEDDRKGDWSFDDDEILDDDDDDDEMQPFNEGNKTMRVAAAPAMPTDKRSRNNVGTVADKAPIQNQRKEQEQWKEPTDEWGFEDDDIDEDELAEPVASQKEEALFQSLVRYLDSLPAILPSLNAVLEAEYNTDQHAKDLNDYYKSRPQLYDYTLETELPRMDYEVVLPNKKRLTNKDDIKQYLSSGQEDNILIRASNQSLLADPLTVLTGPDCFIQHQYLATAMARKCRFVIHDTFVDCLCEMHLSLPTSSGDRLDVARLDLSIHFDKSPSITYRLHRVERLLHDLSALRDTAALLSSMDNDSFLQEEEVQGSDDVVRDAFLARLSQTQQFVEASHHGLSSAWKQIDSVANVSSKLDFIKKGLTLPSTDSVLASSEVATVFESSVPRAAFPRPAPPVGVAKQASAPPRPPPGNVSRGPPPPPRAQDRPAPILGSLLRSGWNRLAQSVTLPDEEEEEVYFPSDFTQVIPKLYRSENEETKNGSQSKPSQHIFQGTPGRHVQDAAMPPPKQVNHEDILPLPSANVQDGWDDDDGDLELDDDDLIVETPNSRPPPPPRPPHIIAPPRPPPPPAVLPPPILQPVLSPPRRTTSPLAVALVEYNPEDDIMPTRKRWVNPRPGNRQIQTR